MQEFIYYNKNEIEFPLPESILVTNKIQNLDSDYIVSNSKMINAQIVAPEIDFYINNSDDTYSMRIKNVGKLYEINAIRFDLAKDILYGQEVDNKLLLICSNEEKKEFLKHITTKEFDIFHISEEILKDVRGHIGNLSITVNDEGKDVLLEVDQIVWFRQKHLGKKQSGCFDPLESSIDETVAQLRANISNYEYKKFTTYDKNICQYHERREEICSKCEEVCPTVAIIKDDEKKHLVFSQIDCDGCGECVSVCPSGALDYAPSNQESISQMARLYKNQIPLIIPQKMNIDNLDIKLKEKILPLMIEGEKFLHEATLLTLLQESGSQVIFYTDFLSKGTKDSIDMLNQIYQKKFGIDAILVAMDKAQLQTTMEEVDFVQNSMYSINHINSNKRETFAIRLSALVDSDDLGVIHTGEYIHYSKVQVDESKCTLCLSCVGACNVNALSAHTDDNTLRLNPSLCTSCGYCEVSCPEVDCLSIQRDVIYLNSTWFEDEILAQDTLFACVECGKEFASKKSIEKIASLMQPLFKSDPIKVKTLYCCEDCKPKIMMNSYLKDKTNYNNITVGI